MYFITFGVFLVVRISNGISVHKCCPSGEFLLNNMTCFGIASNVSYDDVYYWFPFSALFNGTTNLPLGMAGQSLVKDWLGASTAIYSGEFNHFHKNIEFSHNGTYSNNSHYGFKILVVSEEDIQVFVHPDHTTQTFDPRFIIPIEDMCFDLNEIGGHSILFPSSKVFFRKCCDYGKMLNLYDLRCIANSAGVQDDDWMPSGQIKMGKGRRYHLGVPRLSEYDCPGYSVTLNHPNDHNCRGFRSENKFRPNGSFQKGDVYWRPDSFCSEVTLHPDGGIIKQNVVFCENAASEYYNKLPLRTLYGVLFIFGAYILLVTVVICLYLRNLRQRLHNKIAITHNFSLMVAHFAWGAQYFHDDDIHVVGCSIRVLVVQYTFLASLFWLNVFCMDMSSTFRTTRTISSRSTKSENRRYLVYSTYAWGLPACITLFTAVMEFVETPPVGISRPGLACFCQFAHDPMIRFIYMYGPMSIILILNVTLYIFTTWKIVNVRRQTALILKRNSCRTAGSATMQNDYQVLILYTKLFFLMGVTWTLDIVTYMCNVGVNFSTFCDIINISRPIFIFVIFICKRTVFVNLRQQLLHTTGHMEVERTNTDATSTGPSSSGVCSRKGSQQEARQLLHITGHMNLERTNTDASISDV